MITIPTSTPRPIRPAGTRKSEPTLAAGCADALAAPVGLATVTAERVAVGIELAVEVGAGEAVRDAVALGLTDGSGVGLAPGAVVAGDGDAPVVPNDAHARESLTPGAVAQIDRAGVTHELPSAAVRESDNKMKG